MAAATNNTQGPPPDLDAGATARVRLGEGETEGEGVTTLVGDAVAARPFTRTS